VRENPVSPEYREVLPPPAGIYRIEPTGSTVALTIKHVFGLLTVHAVVALASGEMVVAEVIRDSRVAISATADSFDSGNALRDRATKAPRLLDVKRYPVIELKSTTISTVSGQWTVVGDLTIHGVTAPLTLTITDVETDATRVTIRAVGRVDRYVYGIVSMKGMVGRTVELDLRAHATRLSADAGAE
jgi:polyisoprenoid-binding protein YceI